MNTFDGMHHRLTRRGLTVNHNAVQQDEVFLIQPPEFTVDALCAQVDGDMFFPEKGETARPAKRICAACPVINACLTYALEHDLRFGIYGGMSPKERWRLVHRNTT